MKRHLGAFVSGSGGLFNILQRGRDLGVNTVMTHPAPPQRWNSTPFKDEVIDKYNSLRGEYSDIERVFFHGIYLINLANPDSQKFHLSKLSVMHHLDLLNRIDGDGVIFHTGSFKDTTEDVGFDRVIYGLNWIFENIPSEIKGKKLLLECAAGSGSIVGDRMEELQRIYSGVKDEYKQYLGFCLDTQHMFASGYDLINNLEEVVSDIQKYLGLENVRAIHFNDSKTEFASHKDRHANLGEGLIGLDAMKNILNHPKLSEIPFILETPALDELEGALNQVKILKELAS